MISKSFDIIFQAQDSRKNEAQLWTTFKTVVPIPLQHTGNRRKTDHTPHLILKKKKPKQKQKQQQPKKPKLHNILRIKNQYKNFEDSQNFFICSKKKRQYPFHKSKK